MSNKDLLEEAEKLIRQIEMSDFTDENGQKLKMNIHYDRFKELLKKEVDKLHLL